MTKYKFNLKKSVTGIFFALQIIGATVIFSCPLPAFAQSNSDSFNSLKFTPQVTIPNSNFNNTVSTTIGTYNNTTGKIDSTLLAQYIGAIYNYGLAIAGILATIMLMAAGIIWLTSGGDSGKITQAKELISGSIAGLIILIVSWVILNTINPDLVNLKAISSTNLTGQLIGTVGCCDKTKIDGKTAMTTPTNCASGFNKDKVLYNGTCTTLSCCKQHWVDNTTKKEQFTCVNGTQDNCSKMGWDYSSVTCDKDSDCKATGNYLISCVGVANGKHPTNGGSNIWCYHDIAYYSSGLTGEPCGNEEYSKCDSRTCTHDFDPLFTNYRSCTSGLWCCKFTSQGIIIP
jgi:hypothetical protein